jgi:hypothetical protein
VVLGTDVKNKIPADFVLYGNLDAIIVELVDQYPRFRTSA